MKQESMDLFYFKDIVSTSAMVSDVALVLTASNSVVKSNRLNSVRLPSASAHFGWLTGCCCERQLIYRFVVLYSSAQCHNIWLLLGNYSGGIMDVFAGWLNIIIRVLYCMYLISSLGILSSPAHGHMHVRFGHSVWAFRYGQICSASDSIITVCTVCRSHAESITLHSATEITEKYSKYFTWRCCNQSFIVRVNVNAFEWFISV